MKHIDSDTGSDFFDHDNHTYRVMSSRQSDVVYIWCSAQGWRLVAEFKGVTTMTRARQIEAIQRANKILFGKA